MSNESSQSKPLVLACLADLTVSPIGEFILRPQISPDDLDTWIRPKQAAELLGVNPKSVYPLIDAGYLVFYRPLKAVVVVSLKSVRALQAASKDSEFWQNDESKERIRKAVEKRMHDMCRRAAEALQM